MGRLGARAAPIPRCAASLAIPILDIMPWPQTVETGHQRKWPMPFKRCQAISVSWRDD